MTTIFGLDSNIFLTSDRVKIHYLITPAIESVPTLLFIHGMGHDANLWKEEQELLFAKGYPSIAIDLRGHGLSGDPMDVDSYNFDRLSRDVTELVKELNLSSVVLIGHSLGGMVAMYLAGKGLVKLEGLILIETTYRVEFFGLPKKLSKNVANVLKSLAYVFPNGHGKKHVVYDLYSDTTDFDLRRITSDIQTTSLRSYLLACSQAALFDATELLTSIKVPTLVIAGEKDTIIPPEAAIDLTNKIKGADFAIIPDVNHVVTISDPINLSRIIAKFTDSLENS